MNSLIDETWLRRESLSLDYSKRNFPNCKFKRNRLKKKKPQIQELWDSYKKCSIYNGDIKRRGKKQKQYLKSIMTENFSKLI